LRTTHGPDLRGLVDQHRVAELVHEGVKPLGVARRLDADRHGRRQRAVEALHGVAFVRELPLDELAGAGVEHCDLLRSRVQIMIAASSFCALSRSGCPRVAAARGRSHDISREDDAMPSGGLWRILGRAARSGTVTVDPALRSVTADPNQVGRVLLNLVVNARDAMPPAQRRGRNGSGWRNT
jgi:signal transduction histidine kinase